MDYMDTKMWTISVFTPSKSITAHPGDHIDMSTCGKFKLHFQLTVNCCMWKSSSGRVLQIFGIQLATTRPFICFQYHVTQVNRTVSQIKRTRRTDHPPFPESKMQARSPMAYGYTMVDFPCSPISWPLYEPNLSSQPTVHFWAALKMLLLEMAAPTAAWMALGCYYQIQSARIHWSLTDETILFDIQLCKLGFWIGTGTLAVSSKQSHGSAVSL
jgi:hypothetical protein